MKDKIKNKKLKKSPIFLIILFNFWVIVLIAIYMIYLRFIPYKTIIYDGYAVSGKEIANNLLNTTFDVDQTIDAIEVKDQDEIYKNLRSYYVGPAKEKNINIDYPIYTNNNLALYSLSEDTSLITTDLKQEKGYSGLTLTSGALYNADTLERADYNEYILMKNTDNLYINTQEMKIKTNFNKYTIGINSIINFADNYITYYTLKDGKFNYGKILDVDLTSNLEIEYFKRTYTYKEFLLGLNIIKEQIPKEEDTSKEENKIEEPKKIEKEEETTENKVKEEKGTKEEELPQKWQKPNVSCGNFKTNIYTSEVDVYISDPSSAIVKSVIFAFYKEDKLSFRLPITATGKLNVTKLTPNTKYNVIGTYQYKDEIGRTIEVKFTEQEIKTKGTNEIKSIDLNIENGEKYINKIELLNLGIVSNIKDEAIYGVEKATIKLNDVEYPIDSNTLRNLLEGKKIDKYELTKGVLSNKKYNYEIIFYDTASNKMKLINNKGNTSTLKAKPTVDIRLKKQNVVSVDLSLELKNDDNIKISNYRYILYGLDGEQISKENLQLKTNILTFKDLDPEKSYNIKVFADFDMEDGKGKQENLQIGEAIFNTVSLDRLGALKVNFEYDETKDLTSDSIKFIGKIDTKRTDKRLIGILKEVKIDIIDKNKEVVKTYIENELDKLEQDDGKEFLTQGLNSNYEYTINVTAKAKQGNEEKSIKTSYTLKSFETKKSTPTANISQIVTTNNTVEFALYIDDKDGASLKKDEQGRIIYKYKLKYYKEENIDTDEYEIAEEGNIRANSKEIIKFEDTMKDGEYKIDFIAEEYNDTNYNKYKEFNFIITNDDIKFIPSGLTGMLDLMEVQKEKVEGKNLVDITANNNWYSKCFDVINKKEELESSGNKVFKIESTRDYGKTYNVEDNTSTLNLTANQCYVYNFKEYIGQTVTMSFKAEEGSTKIYIQEGKESDNLISINDSKLERDGKIYCYTTKIPSDGYLGFFIEKTNVEETEVATIKDLQVELGKQKTLYENYKYGIAKSKINYDLKASNYVELEKEQQNSVEYYIKINDVKDINIETGLEQIGDVIEGEKNNKNSKSFSKTYKILKDGDYKVQLVASIYGREHILDEVNFNYSEYNKANYKYSEVKYISTAEEFKEMQPDGNYFILNNIKLTKESKESEYTFGNDNIKFNGKIDFDGKTVSKDVVLDNGDKNTSYIFYNIGENATISNIVLDFYINNNEDMYKIDKLDGLYGIFLYNKGQINNLRVNLKQCESSQESPILRRYIGLIGYKNIGTIDKFIINLEVGLYAEQYVAGGCLESSGIIKNGYMYGENIYLQNEINTGTSRNSAGIVYDLNGNLKNIYNLTGIEIKHCQYTDSFAANIAYKVNGGAKVENVYTVKDIGVFSMNKYALLDREGKEVNNGPNVCESSGGVNRSYYFCEHMNNERTGEDTYSEKSNLVNFRFQNMLNDNDNSFNVENQIEKGYYPNLRLNKCMPPQEKIKMFDSYKGDNEIDLLEDTVKVHNKDTINDEIKNIVEKYKNFIKVDQGESIEEALLKHILLGYDKEEDKKINDAKEEYKDKSQEYILNKLLQEEIIDKENQYLITMEVYNPAGYNIGQINLNNISAKVLTQYKSMKSKKTVVIAVIKNPRKYVDQYRITSIKDTEGNVQDNDISKILQAPCYKSIRNVDDWKQMYVSIPIGDIEQNNVKDGLEQNYKLKEDLDFNGIDLGDLFKDSVFSGTIKGNGYTLKNINTKYPIFKIVRGKISDLNIENYESQQEDDNSVGIIGTLSGKAENINVRQVSIYVPKKEDIQNITIGGFCGTVSSSGQTLKNNIENLKIKIGNQSNLTIGGLYGTITGNNNTISESEVKNVEIYSDDAINAENFIAGGICGNNKGKTKIQYSYVDEFKINCKENKGYKIGGILGTIERNAGEMTTQTLISNCFAQNIDIKMENTEISGLGGILGYGNNATKDNYIQYCWVHGKVRSNRGNIGGIVAYLYWGTVNGCYSLLDVSSRLEDNTELAVIQKDEWIRGIVGKKASYKTIVTNNMYLGNIETESIINENIGRISEGSETKKDNYAYKNQVIGKTKVNDKMDSTDLWDTNDNEINTKYSALEGIKENYKIPENDNENNEYQLPVLIKDGKELTNQLQNKLDLNTEVKEKCFDIIGQSAYRFKDGKQVEDNNENIIDVNVCNDQNPNGVRTQIIIRYKANYKYKIKSVKFGLDAMTVIGDIPESTLNDDGTYTLVFYAKPEKYLDNYYIKTITYENENNEEVNEELYPKRIINVKYYKQIASEDDWNTKMTKDKENYLLTNDIKFNSIDEKALNCKINRLEGVISHTIELNNDNSYYGDDKREIINKEDGEKYISASFIDTIYKLQNVNFSNFTVNNGCLINTSEHDINNCNFENIKIIYDNNTAIDSSEKQYVGIIGRAITSGTKMLVQNIKNVTVVAEEYKYVGGLCGHSQRSFYNGNIVNIDNIKISGGTLVGGVMGYGTGFTGSFNISNIDINAKSYVGGLCGNNISHINNTEKTYEINLDTININGQSFIGGLCGVNYGNINNKNTKSEIVGKNITINAKSYTGGIIGEEKGKYIYNIKVEDKLSIVSSGTAVGGIIGKSSAECENLQVIGKDDQKQITIESSSYNVGGIIGYTTNYSNNLIFKNGDIKCMYNGAGCIGSTNGKSETLIVENVVIEFSGKGNDNYSNIGGCIGKSNNKASNLRSNNIQISHMAYIIGEIKNVGGCIGYISTECDDLLAEEISIDGEAYNVGGCVGMSDYIIYNARSNNNEIKGKRNIGGIVGEQTYNNTSENTIYNCKVESCNITGTGNNTGGIVGNAKGMLCKITASGSTISGKKNAGGLIGLYEGGDKSYETYYLIQSYCSKSNINATENAGGLVGEFVFGDIRYCYSANNKISGNNSGQLIGYLNDTDLNTKINNKVVNVIYTLAVNTLNSTENYFNGSIIGKQEKELDKEAFLNNIIVNEIEKYYTNNTGEVTKIDNVDDIKTGDIYKNIGLLRENKFKHKDGYYSYLTGVFENDNTDFEKQKIEVQENDLNTTSNKNNSLIAVMSLKQNIFEQIELPDVYVYAVDVDKINIEFNKINPNTYFKIEANGNQILSNTPIEEKIYTFEYDFNTDFSIKISSLENWYKKDIKANDLKNLLDIQENEYLYLTENKIYSNKKNIDGEYLNLYKGKALSTDYKIYNLESMDIVKRHKGVLTSIKEKVAIASKEYNDNKIETFYHCSKITDKQGNYTYQDKQIFIKNGLMFMLDGSLQSKGNSVIIDSYNNNQYETILGVDNRIYNLLSEIKYPANFKNEKILQMTGNVDNNNNIILVYYESGKVYGFNYITGEEVFNNNVKEQNIGLITFITNNFNTKKVLYNINKDTYNQAQKLTDKLEKTSIQQAVIKLDLENKGNGKAETDQKKDNNTDNNIKYAQMYDTKNNKYVVYSSQDLIKTNLKSEDEKIEENKELITFYANVSTSKVNFKQIGMILFIIVVGTVCVILMVMYRKSHKGR